MDYICRDK